MGEGVGQIGLKVLHPGYFFPGWAFLARGPVSRFTRWVEASVTLLLRRPFQGLYCLARTPLTDRGELDTKMADVAAEVCCPTLMFLARGPVSRGEAWEGVVAITEINVHSTNVITWMFVFMIFGLMVFGFTE